MYGLKILIQYFGYKSLKKFMKKLPAKIPLKSAKISKNSKDR